MSRCTGHIRHWFAAYGHPGTRLPKCIRCGAPNPRTLTTDDWHEILATFPDLTTWSGERVIDNPEKLREQLKDERNAN